MHTLFYKTDEKKSHRLKKLTFQDLSLCVPTFCVIQLDYAFLIGHCKHVL